MTCGKFSVGKGSILLPMDDGAKELTKKVGDVVEVEAMHDRDMVYHRRVFATIRELAEAIGQSPEWLRAQLLVYCGLCHVVGTLDGRHALAVSSMSRHSMRDDELHHFWDDSKEHIISRVLPLIANRTLRDQLHHAVTSF